MKQILLLVFALCSVHFLGAQTLILDFENAATSTSYGYFGSSLEGPLRQAPIANPDPSGINTSDSVMVHVKAANSQVWSGAFADPLPGTAIDLVNNNQVCMDVWLPEPGTVRLKLEQSTDGGGDWERDADNAVTEGMTWTQVCWNVALPSIGFGTEGNVPAGFTYPQPVVFFNFGTSYDSDQTFYWDNLEVSSATPSTASVDFAVNMSEYTDDFTTVYVSGTFNGWDGTANPLSDDDGDNIWTTTIDGIELGSIEYKFQVDGWTDQEFFNGTEVCTVTDGDFTNRVAAIGGDMSLPTFCWESCYNCGESVDITINLGGANAANPAAGFFIAGGGNFGAPGDFELTDDDQDGIYSITINRQTGFNSFYTFTNGVCPDFSCKENIEGQDCANPANFNDRFLPAVTQDTVLNLCFSDCSTEAADCANALDMVSITFNLGGADAPNPAAGFFIAGGGNFGNPGDFELTDDDQDGIYSITIMRPEGFSSFYTFTNGACPDYSCKENIEGQDCANPDNFNDRFLPAVAQDTVLNLCFGDCSTEAADCAVVVEPCDADAGTNTTTATDFVGGEATITITATGDAVLPTGYGLIYVLTSDPNLTIVDANATGEFIVTSPGTYTGHTFVAQTTDANGDNYVDLSIIDFGTTTAGDVINALSGICYDLDATGSTVTVGGGGATTPVTFQVDMSIYEEDFGTAYVSGSFNGWDGTANPLQDDDADGIWETTIDLAPGDYEFKFQLDAWTVDEQFEDGDTCTITDASGQFVNRFVTVGTMPMTICKGWNTCLDCDQLIATRELLLNNNLFTLRPALATETTQVMFAAPTRVETIRLFTATGQLVQQMNVGALLTDYQLDLAPLSAGVYLVSVQTTDGVATRRLVRQ